MSEYFHEGHWGQCLELLSHLCQYSDSIILVTGPEGIGKTTMKKALVEDQAQNYVVCDVRATPTLTSEHLTTRIEQDFDENRNQDLLLLIDDAQDLALEVIAVLLQLKQKTAILGRLHIALFATSELEQKIARSVLKEDFADQVHGIEIEPFSLDEVEAFLTYRDILVDRSKLKKIYLLSGGIPGKVEHIASDMINGKKVSKNRESQQSISPFMVGVTVSFGLLFCILAIMWPAADSSLLNKTKQVSQPLTIASDEATMDNFNEMKVAELEPEHISVTDVIAVAEQAQPEISPEPQSAPQGAAITPKLDPYEQKIAELEQKINDLQIQVAHEQKAQRATELKLQQLIANKKSEPIKTAKKTLSNKPLSLTKQEKHILALPGKNYTLQLLCLNNEGKVQDFIKENNLQTKAYYYKSFFKEKNWYIVVYGSYATKAAADMAAAKLPPALKKLHPWPREYANIHKSIKDR